MTGYEETRSGFVPSGRQPATGVTDSTGGRGSRTPRRRPRAATAAAGVAALLVLPAGAAAQGPPIDEVMARAAERVTTVIEELATVVMEEDYSQVYFSRQRRSNPARSHLRSDFLQVRLAGSEELTGFRDVIEYNGQRVRDREDRLAELFLGSHETAMDQLRRITEENARYNVGSTHRTFNVPTFGLFCLHPANAGRFRFEKDGDGCAGVDAAWEVRFDEVASPTMTLGFGGIDLPAHGRVCVDPETGDVYETEIELRHPAVEGRLETEAQARVTFGREAQTGLWVPVEMRERYEERGGGSMSGTARYSDFRRFAVAVDEDWTEEPEPK